MGNYILYTKEHPPANSIGIIKENLFTKENSMPPEVLRKGQMVKILKSGNLYQSRPNAPPISYCTVLFKDGKRDAYLTSNIEFKK